MNSHALGVTVGGLVAGMMLAAAITSDAGVAFAGSLQGVSIRPPSIVQEITREPIGSARRVRYFLEDMEEETTPSIPSVISAACNAVKKMYGDVSAAVTLALPSLEGSEDANKNMLASTQINAALDASLNHYCKTDALLEEDGITVTVDNQCERFNVGTPRYITCLENEEAGQPY